MSAAASHIAGVLVAGQACTSSKGWSNRRSSRGLSNVFSVYTDPKGFTRKVNTELRRLFELSNGADRNAARKIADIDTKIANIRQSIEDGLADVRWTNERLNSLFAEREQLSGSVPKPLSPPQINIATALQYRRNAEKVLESAEMKDRKRLLRSCIDTITLNPTELDVEIRYRIPEGIMNSEIAGGGFEPPTFGL